MKQYIALILAPFLLGTACNTQQSTQSGFTGAKGEVKLVTLDPGHFPRGFGSENILSTG